MENLNALTKEKIERIERNCRDNALAIKRGTEEINELEPIAAINVLEGVIQYLSEYMRELLESAIHGDN